MFIPQAIKGKFHKNHSIQFSIPVTNSSEEPVHINKNTFLGLIHKFDQIQENADRENIISLVQIKLIPASEDILKSWKL